MALGQLLGLVNGLLDGLDSGLNIHHHTLLQATGRTGTHTHHLQLVTGQYFGNQGHHLGGAYIQSDYHVLTCLVRH